VTSISSVTRFCRALTTGFLQVFREPLAHLVPFLCVILAATPCRAEEPIRVGVSLGLTGQFAVMPDALHKGFTLWQRHVERSGGILKRPVRVIVRDDQSDPGRAQTLYADLIEKEKVDFPFAPYSSLITEAVLPVAEKHGVPTLIAGAAADRLWEKGLRNAIGVYTPASRFTFGFLELVLREGVDGIGLLSADDPFSRDLAEGAKKWSGRLGLHIVSEESFRKGTLEQQNPAMKVRDKGAQVLVLCGHMEEAVYMTRHLAQSGWRPKAFYSSVGPALQDYYDRCGKEGEGVFSTSLWEPRANYPGAQGFERDFVATFGQTPGYHAGLAYAAGQVLEEAIREARSVDRGKVRSALFQLDTMTIIGRFGVDNTGKQVRQHTFIIQWQDGRKELVWPQEIRTKEPRFR